MNMPIRRLGLEILFCLLGLPLFVDPNVHSERLLIYASGNFTITLTPNP